MITVGIIGGVASGKSTIAEKLESLGAHVFDADEIGHQVLDESAVIDAARGRWGDEVVDSDGRLIRSAIAAHVFAHDASPAAIAKAAQELKFWESQTHPRITRRVAEDLRRLAEESASQKSGNRVVVLDAAVLLKAGWDGLCDQLIFVDVPQETRLKRGLARGWSAEHFAAREAAQLPLEEKKKKATVVIDNGGTLDQTYEQVLGFWQSLSG